MIIFFFTIVAGQSVSYKLLTADDLGKQWLKEAVALRAIMVLACSLLSFYPPHCFLFEDPETGEYGIFESYEGDDHEEDHDE